MYKVIYIILWRFLEDIKFTIIEGLQSSWGTDHGIIKSMQKKYIKQIIECKALERHIGKKLLTD